MEAVDVITISHTCMECLQCLNSKWWQRTGKDHAYESEPVCWKIFTSPRTNLRTVRLIQWMNHISIICKVNPLVAVEKTKLQGVWISLFSQRRHRQDRTKADNMRRWFLFCTRRDEDELDVRSFWLPFKSVIRFKETNGTYCNCKMRQWKRKDSTTFTNIHFGRWTDKLLQQIFC